MAGTYTLIHSSVQGDIKVQFYNVTNFTNAETLSTGMRQILFASAVPNSADKTIAMTFSAGTITFVTGADTYDGLLKVEGRE